MYNLIWGDQKVYGIYRHSKHNKINSGQTTLKVGSGTCTVFYCILMNKCNKDGIVYTRLRSAVGNVSGYRCVSDCRSRGRKFDPGPVPYFRGD